MPNSIIRNFIGRGKSRHDISLLNAAITIPEEFNTLNKLKCNDKSRDHRQIINSNAKLIFAFKNISFGTYDFRQLLQFQQLSLFTLIANCNNIHRFTKNLINRNINHTLNKLQYKSQDYIMISRVPIYKKKLIDIFTRNSNSFTITFTFKILDCTIPKLVTLSMNADLLDVHLASCHPNVVKSVTTG